MLEEQIREGFSPLVAVLTSDGVQKVTSKVGLTFADLLLPFSTVNCSLKDLNGCTVTSRIYFDFRDLNTDGFLLSLTVLPNVLHEAVSSVASTSNANLSLASSVFSETLLRWFEPAEHEFLKTYVGCLFVVCASDEDPLDELSKLCSIQHQQQHDATVAPIGPAHCAPSKWMLPNIFKYYVLVDDGTSTDPAKSQSVFESMCAKYGSQSCHLLRLSSDTECDITNPWESLIVNKYRGIEKGLALAKRKVLSKSSSVNGVSTVSSDCCSVIAVNNSALADRNGLINVSFDPGTRQTGRQLLTYECRENIVRMVDTMIMDALIPYVENQIRVLNELVIARRGISKSLSGVRKWFGAAAVQPATSSSYTQDSPEMQIRRLADLCFIFGLYSCAFQFYQNMRKDFSVDQAWLHHAGALEMSALSMFLCTPQMVAKQYTQHYMDDAINCYAKDSVRPILAMRAVLLSTLMLSSLQLYIEAATQLLKLTTFDDDLFCGVILERASVYFSNANMHRKEAFHYVLAGHRFFKAAQKQLSLECYKKALSQYEHKNWNFAEDHVLSTLARECTQSDQALNWCEQLIRRCNAQTIEQQCSIFQRYVAILSSLNSSKHVNVCLPCVKIEDISVIYGQASSHTNIDSLISAQTSMKIDGSLWNDLEMCAYFVIVGNCNGYRATRTISTAQTDNSEVSHTPPSEKFRLRIMMKNTLGVALKLKKMHLKLSADPKSFAQNFFDEFTFEPDSDWVSLEFFVIPGQNLDEIRVEGILFDLVVDQISVACCIPLSLNKSRPRSNSNKNSRTLRSIDNRLIAKVSKLQWPLMDIAFPSKNQLNAFCGQIYQFDFEATNIGSVPVQAFCIASDQPEMLAVFIEEAHVMQCVKVPSKNKIGIFHVSEEIRNGEKIRLRLCLRAPCTELSGHCVAILFYYRGVNGAIREERHLITINTRKLLDVSLSVADRASGAYVLRAHNLLPNKNSLLAKIELLRIQKILTDSSHMHIRNLSFHALQKNHVHLDCMQAQNYCFLMNAESGHSVLWISDKTWDLPEMPNSEKFLQSSQSGLQNTVYANGSAAKTNPTLYLGILWKANIVNSDGTLTSVFGENFVEHSIRINSSSVDHRPLGGRVPSESLFQPVICTIHCVSSTIYHDFSQSKLCKIPVKIVVENNGLSSGCDHEVIVRFQNAFLRRKVPHAIVDPSYSAFSGNNNEPLMIANRTIMRSTVASGETHQFAVTMHVACSSVYNLGRFHVVCRSGNSSVEMPVHVPSKYISVIDQRV